MLPWVSYVAVDKLCGRGASYVAMGKLCGRGQAVWPWMSCVAVASCAAVGSGGCFPPTRLELEPQLSHLPSYHTGQLKQITRSQPLSARKQHFGDPTTNQTSQDGPEQRPRA